MKTYPSCKEVKPTTSPRCVDTFRNNGIIRRKVSVSQHPSLCSSDVPRLYRVRREPKNWRIKHIKRSKDIVCYDSPNIPFLFRIHLDPQKNILTDFKTQHLVICAYPLI